MLIVSQEKTEIINFDNVNTLQATKTGRIVSYENTYRAEDDWSNILGEYKTESRAKEVLKEIISWIENKCDFSMDRDVFQVTRRSDVFYMPEE